jgi:hypothetical protein
MRAVNLIPADHRGGASRGAVRSNGAAYAVPGVLATLVLLAVLYGVAKHQISTRTTKAVTLEARAQQVQGEATKLSPYTSFVALREQRVKAVSDLVNSRFDWAHAFHELGRVLPPNVAITSLDGTVGTVSTSATASASATAPPAAANSSGGGSVTSVTPSGSVPSFTLSGCAKTQSTVALTLERLRLIDGVHTVTLASSTSTRSVGGGAGGSVVCPVSYPVFNVVVTFDPLPASTATSTPPGSGPVSSTLTSKSPGGSR